MNVLDLFSGIGGFSLGLERAGFRTSAFCEINPYARAVLAKHWPGVPIYDDICSLSADRLAADGVAVDVVCGGFPCQDISLAGTGGGLDGERSGLWFEMLRVIAETRPAWVIAENVAALRSRGLDTVLRGLAAVGYDAEWHCIPAAAVGAPHRRDRVWIMANPRGGQCGGPGGWEVQQPGRAEAVGAGQDVDHTLGQRRDTGRHDHAEHDGQQFGAAGQHAGDVAHSEHAGRDAGWLQGHGEAASSVGRREAGSACGPGADVADAGCDGGGQEPGHLPGQAGEAALGAWRRLQSEPGDGGPAVRSVYASDQWLAEPDVGRVADGVPSRVDRLRCLGNAVVPQIPEILGRAILNAT